MGQGRDDNRRYPADGTAAADPGALDAFAAALTAMADEVGPPLRRLGAEALAYQLRPHPGGPDLGAYVEGTDRASLAAARLAAMAASVHEVGLAFHTSDLDRNGRALRSPYRLDASDRAPARSTDTAGLPLLSFVPPVVAAARRAHDDERDERDDEHDRDHNHDRDDDGD